MASVNKRILWEALKETWWEQAAAVMMAAFASAAFRGGILTRAATELTTSERVATMSAVLAAGVFAAVLKYKNLMSYGFAELSFAIALTWAILSRQLGHDSVVNALTLLASTFLTSRAVGNIWEGAKQQQASRVQGPR